MPPTVAYYYDEEIGALDLGREWSEDEANEKRGRRMFGKPMLMLAERKKGKESSMR